MTHKKAFYAYSSDIVIAENIRKSISLINEKEIILISSWEDFSIAGKPIIDQILKAIDSCDLFMCDITDLNDNVLFELGYAIAQNKKIWITLNSNKEDSSKKYKKFHLINHIGYSPYETSEDLKNSFIQSMPHESLKPIYEDTYPEEFSRNVIHLKCEQNTSEAHNIITQMKKLNVPHKIEDPYEGAQPLDWYLSVLPRALGVIIHFNDEHYYTRNPIPKARKCFLAGLSLGMGLKTLILAHAPYEPPLDIFDKVKVHKNPSEAQEIIFHWLEPISKETGKLKEDYREHLADQKALGKLSNLIIGDYVAENENSDLVEYFFETAEYKEALVAQQVLFVGRKGTGKTANLIKLKNDLGKDSRNFVVTILPQGHEFDGVLDILKTISTSSEKGHLIESIWEYLIITEIAKQYYEHLDSRPLHHQKTKEEEDLYKFIKQNEVYIDADFTLRLENIISNLKELNSEMKLTDQRLKVSEYLHGSIISKLRNQLGKVLNRKEKVTILIDNLDRSWGENSNWSELSELLFGLLNVTQKITDEFSRKSYKDLNVNLSLIVFLRSDIFSRILSFASERDKVPYKYLHWEDPKLLFKIIEHRVDYSVEGITSPKVLWENYFCAQVDGLPLHEYVESLILPRPRDIIYLFKSALYEAINKEHTKVTEEDFQLASYKYSEYALDSLLPENAGRIEDFDSLLYEFVGEEIIISHEKLEEILVGYNPDSNQIIDILCEMTFLGKEIREDIFEFYSEKKNKKITDNLARKLSQKNGNKRRYKINNAFANYLEIDST